MLNNCKRYILVIITTLLCNVITARATQQCDSLLQQAIEASIERDYRLSMEMLSKAMEIATEKNQYEQQFWILSNIGINYAEMSNYSKALESLSEAYKIAINNLNERHELSILNNIAGVYMLDKQYGKAIEQYETVYRLAAKSDSVFVGGCALNIANAWMCMDNMENTAQYLEIAEEMFINHPLEMLNLNILKASYLCKCKRYNEAYEMAMHLITEARKSKQYSIEPAALLIITQTMFDTDNYHSTIRYANEALQHTISIEERINLYDVLAQSYQQTHNFNKALAYKDSIIILSDSIWNEQEQRQFEYASIQIELLQRENEIEGYRTRTRNSYIILSLGFFTALVLAWALANQFIKNRQQKEISQLQIEKEKQRQQLLQNQLDEHQAQSLLEKERFKHEIEMRDKELMSKAMVVANRNDTIAGIINTLSHTRSIKESNDTELKRTITQLQRSLDETEAWQDFSTYFEHRNDTFIAALTEKHPELNANEVRFLSLVYLNFSTKEIASLLNITAEYCKKKKLQLARKMGFENSKSLYSYLNTLA